MDDTLLREQLRQSEERNEALSRELASLRASLDRVLEEFAAFRRDYEALVDATRIITDERDSLRQRVAELEAANNRLIDMLWGRRSERRSESPDQRQLDFGDEPAEPPSAEEQEIITAQAEADEAPDRELLRRLEARRKARREKTAAAARSFRRTIERRERVLDLPEEQKQGLKPIGVKTTERLRFEKPHVYVEVIKRPQYVVAGPAGGRRAEHAAAAVDRRGLQVRLQRGGGDGGDEVRLPHADVSAAGLVRPVRLVPQPLDGERSDELRRGHDRPLVPADVAVAACAADPAGRRHDAVRAVARRPGRGGSGEARAREAVFARHWRRAGRRTRVLPVRPPVTPGCTRAWTAWPRTMCFTGR